MLSFLKQLPIVRRFFKTPISEDTIVEEQWTADFSKNKNVRFELKSEAAYDSFIREKALVLAIKRSNCLAWTADMHYRYADAVIDGRIRLNPKGGYAAAGISFRFLDEYTNYTLLLSSRGYFRIDVLRNGTPISLLAWTEIPGIPVNNAAPFGAPEGGEFLAPVDLDSFNEAAFPVESLPFRIILLGERIFLSLNRRWAVEVRDSTIPAGRIALACASYEGSSFSYQDLLPAAVTGAAKGAAAGAVHGVYSLAETVMESLSIESRSTEVESAYVAWERDYAPEPASRLRLAETFAVMGLHAQALDHLRANRKTDGYAQDRKELLLMGREALAQEFLGEAEEAIDACLEGHERDSVWEEGIVEKIKLLYLSQKHDELRGLAQDAGVQALKNAIPQTLLGHAFFEAGDYKAAAAAYDAALALETENGIPAKNAANTYELLDDKANALNRYMEAGRRFLNQSNYADLGTVIPKLLSLGENNWEARALAGKWAFGIEDWPTAEAELELSETLRKKKRNSNEDAAVVFLRGLLLLRQGRRSEAQPFLERAAGLEPEYPLFHFKAAENRFLLYDDCEDPELKRLLKTALDLAPDKLPEEDGWIANLAAQIALRRGDLSEAEAYLARAAKKLGEVPAIRVNRAVHAYIGGSPEKALEILKAEKHEDPEGILANCAGNLLVRDGRYEEADDAYRMALSIAGENGEFLQNRASCLIEMGLYGEAEDVLARAYRITPVVPVLELAAWVAVKKGEYSRAETAYKSALEQDADNPSVLTSLGWLYAATFRWDDLEPILQRLEQQKLTGVFAERTRELRTQIDEAQYKSVPCASCDRTWKILKDPPLVPPLRLFSEPPDQLPAGTCTECGSTYCIGCAKNHLDRNKRFLCPNCGKTLKLVQEGLKKLVYDWAQATAPGAGS